MERIPAHLTGGPRYVTLVLIAAAAVAAAFALARGARLTAAVVVAATLALSLLSVRGYSVEGRTLRVHRPGWSTWIELDGVASARPEPHLVRRSLSLFSTRGAFGVIGYLRLPGGERALAFVTDPGRVILLRFGNRPAVAVSPSEPGRFLEALGLPGGGGTADAPPQLAPRPPPPVVRSP